MTEETPSHYAEGLALDVLDLMETMDKGLRKAFCFGNAMKYVARAGLKDGETTLQDLKKARQYLCEAGYSPSFIWTFTGTENFRKTKGIILKKLMIGWNTGSCEVLCQAAGAIAGWIAYEEKKVERRANDTA